MRACAARQVHLDLIEWAGLVLGFYSLVLYVPEFPRSSSLHHIQMHAHYFSHLVTSSGAPVDRSCSEFVGQSSCESVFTCYRVRNEPMGAGCMDCHSAGMATDTRMRPSLRSIATAGADVAADADAPDAPASGAATEW